VLFAEIVNALQKREDAYPRIVISEVFKAMKIDSEDFCLTKLYNKVVSGVYVNIHF
jgi:hypothetical protein